MAPTPAVLGYSLVGVYPCAVFKPRGITENIRPIRNRVAGVNRAQPYTAPPQQQQQQQQQQQNQQQSQGESSNFQGQSSTDTTAAARVQAPQLLVTACSCRDPNNPTDINQLTTAPTPMLFVPFSVPNFAPAPMTGSNLHATNCSPSKVKICVSNLSFILSKII